ncbi:MAG TPA: MarR family winged helix-turn-helix transcriptional regulator [Anaeromyxobacteraceae bacterium]|nr:MarR family winged helix-turn-helix transcriptional regulator [Anaeromyxobacteraceae bacterium]
MKRPEAPPDVLEVMQGLWALAHALEARSKRMHRDLGITGPQRLLLRVVGRSPGCGPGEAARKLSLNPGTVTRLAAGLERRRLIRREVDPVDGRRQRLVLTPRGKVMNGQHRGTVEGAVREALAGASPDEVRQARQFIRRLTASLDVRRPEP